MYHINDKKITFVYINTKNLTGPRLLDVKKLVGEIKLVHVHTHVWHQQKQTKIHPQANKSPKVFTVSDILCFIYNISSSKSPVVIFMFSAYLAAGNVQVVVMPFCISEKAEKAWNISIETRIWQLSKADSRLAPSQWEMLLQSNAVSHWLGANLESALVELWRFSCFYKTENFLLVGVCHQLDCMHFVSHAVNDGLLWGI